MTPQAAVEEGMRRPEVLTSTQQPFGGVGELRLYEEGLRVIPILRIRKMRGNPPQPGHCNFASTQNGMEVSVYGK